MKCLNGFSSASSGMFSMERSTEEHLELFLDAEIFLVAIFSLFSRPVSIFLASTFSNFTLVSHEEIRCRLASARCDRLYRAEVSKATGPTSAHSREAVQCPSSHTKCNDRKFLSVFKHLFFYLIAVQDSSIGDLVTHSVSEVTFDFCDFRVLQSCCRHM